MKSVKANNTNENTLLSQESIVEARLMKAMLNAENQAEVWKELVDDGHDLSEKAFKELRQNFYNKIDKGLRTDQITEFIDMIHNHDATYRMLIEKIQRLQHEITLADDRQHAKLRGELAKQLGHALKSLLAKENLVQMTHRDIRMRVSNPESVSAHIASMLTPDNSLDVDAWNYDKPINSLHAIDTILNDIEHSDSIYEEVLLDQDAVTDGEDDIKRLEAPSLSETKITSARKYNADKAQKANSEDIAKKLDELV